MEMQELLDWGLLISHLITIGGVFWGIDVYKKAKEKERIDREYGTYNALDDKYIEYLAYCIQYPKLDLYFVTLPSPPALTPEEEIQQLALFEILIAQMERAFLMYSEQSVGFRSDQWVGWEAYITRWAARPNFGKLLKKIGGDQFDKKFHDFLIAKISSTSVNKKVV